jgi:hypothetical protein
MTTFGEMRVRKFISVLDVHIKRSPAGRVAGASVGVSRCGRAGAHLVRLMCACGSGGGRRPAVSHAVHAHECGSLCDTASELASLQLMERANARCVRAATTDPLKVSCWTAAWTTAGHSRHSRRPRLTATPLAPHVVESLSPVSTLHARTNMRLPHAVLACGSTLCHGGTTQVLAPCDAVARW